mgnify:CR=1 FL=1
MFVASNIEFQSFLFWMLIRKAFIFFIAKLPILRFNPSYSGCWFGRSNWKNNSWCRKKFQSFLFWMLIRKISTNVGSTFTSRVSILLILDVDSEAVTVGTITASIDSFNPSYSGCWFGSICEISQKGIIRQVSILLILDVDSEDAIPNSTYTVGNLFQSFLFWMLIRKKLHRLIMPYKGKVSILLILDVDSEVSITTTGGPLVKGFNPSYSGCWFGSNDGAGNIGAAIQVSILLILDVDSEVKSDLCGHFNRCSFNPSYSGCWFGSRELDISNLLYVGSFNPSYSGCWFGRHGRQCHG